MSPSPSISMKRNKVKRNQVCITITEKGVMKLYTSKLANPRLDISSVHPYVFCIKVQQKHPQHVLKTLNRPWLQVCTSFYIRDTCSAVNICLPRKKSYSLNTRSTRHYKSFIYPLIVRALRTAVIKQLKSHSPSSDSYKSLLTMPRAKV